MFLGMGVPAYQYDKGLLLEIENQRDTVLTFMVPQFWETRRKWAHSCNNGLLNQYMMLSLEVGAVIT
jgi:hypothetical protein